MCIFFVPKHRYQPWWMFAIVIFYSSNTKSYRNNFTYGNRILVLIKNLLELFSVEKKNQYKMKLLLTHPRFSTKMSHIHIWCRVSNFRHILICCLRFHESSWYLDRAVYPCHQSDQRKNLQKSKIQLWFDCLGKNNAELFHANRYQSKCLRANDLNHRVCYKLLSQLRFSFHSVKDIVSTYLTNYTAQLFSTHLYS